MRQLIVTIGLTALMIAACGPKDVTWKRPADVPSDAIWIGGVDGGCWVEIKDELPEDKYWIAVHFQNGGLWIEDTFYVEEECRASMPDSGQIMDWLSDFNGYGFELKIDAPAGKRYCYLMAYNPPE
jgi:hypothetical protein